MITVWGGWPTRAFRVLWLLEEMGVDYRFRAVDIRKRGTDTAFLELNPAGFLPVLQEGDITMVESIAIMEHIVRRFGPTDLAPDAPADAHARYQQFLHLGEAGMAAYLNIAVASRFFAPEGERDNWGARAAEQMFFNRLDLVARRLNNSPYLVGEAFTAADISIAYALELGARLGLQDRYGTGVASYMRTLSEREAYQRALAKSPPW